MKKTTKSQKINPLVSVIMGSDSDLSVMNDAARVLEEFQVPFEMMVVSAHRTPDEMADYAKTAKDRGIRVIIAGAGGAAHLPGMVAAFGQVPVIGVPVPVGPLQGKDALMSIVQMPKGVPVATVAIGNSQNAALLAIQILAFGGEKPNTELQDKLADFRDALRDSVLAQKLKSKK